MKREVKVAIIGAGSAGLYALSQVKKQTDNFILINSGPYGTTCARVGCMPSKSLIRIAEYYHERLHFEKSGIQNSDALKVSIPDVLQRVRDHRDFLVNGNIKHSITRLGDKVLSGRAEFINKNTLKVGDDVIVAEKIIIATGSSPVFDPKWESFKEHILTTDDLFEQKDLPPTLGVIGLGVIGLELGQALSRLGIYDMLELPFYHPTLEEGLYSLLLSCARQIGKKTEGIREVPYLGTDTKHRHKDQNGFSYKKY